MKKFYTAILILFLFGMFMTVGGQDAEPLGRAIGNGVEGGLSFLGSIWDAVTE